MEKQHLTCRKELFLGQNKTKLLMIFASILKHKWCTFLSESMSSVCILSFLRLKRKLSFSLTTGKTDAPAGLPFKLLQWVRKSEFVKCKLWVKHQGHIPVESNSVYDDYMRRLCVLTESELMFICCNYIQERGSGYQSAADEPEASPELYLTLLI